MQNVISILMQRDGLTHEDARDLVREARAAILEASHEGGDPEEVWTDMTGLEPDYILDII